MTRRRFDLTDFEWTVIQPLLPNKPRGVPRVGGRRVFDGILWRFRTGSTWADVPDRYGRQFLCPRSSTCGHGKKGVKTMAAWGVPVAA